MSGGSWKVAYADFVTAMMAFFLLMWILNMAPKDAEEGSAGEGAVEVIQPDAQYDSSSSSPRVGGKTVQFVDKLDTREFNAEELEHSYYAIAQSVKDELSKDALPRAVSGVSTNEFGVLINLTSSLMFEPGTTRFTKEGDQVLDAVKAVMDNYKVYLVVRGYTDSSETGKPDYPSKWELSAARANAAIAALIAKGVDPARMRGVAYADTKPLVPSTVPGSVAKNSRVEFNFHRPEVMSTVAGF